MTIYERIKHLRISLGMSQSELAQRVGYEGKSAISKVENGERDISQSMIIKYAEALNVTPAYLLTGEDVNETDGQNGKPLVSDSRFSKQDSELVFALWGDSDDIDEKDLDDVKRFAAFIKERKQKK